MEWLIMLCCIRGSSYVRSNQHLCFMKVIDDVRRIRAFKSAVTLLMQAKSHCSAHMCQWIVEHISLIFDTIIFVTVSGNRLNKLYVKTVFTFSVEVILLQASWYYTNATFHLEVAFQLTNDNAWVNVMRRNRLTG